VTYLFILIGYAVLMIAFGVIFSRHVRESGDFFVAGRGLNAGLIFSTLLAANIRIVRVVVGWIGGDRIVDPGVHCRAEDLAHRAG
jgi:hypothetical protein